MAEIKFTIPDARMPEVIDAWASNWLSEIPSPDTGEMVPNPMTKPQFAKEQIKQEIVRRIHFHESSQLPDFPIT